MKKFQLLLLGMALGVAGCVHQSQQRVDRFSLALGSKAELSPWDDAAILKQLNFKLSLTTKQEVVRVLGSIAERYSFCELIERGGRVVFRVPGDVDESQQARGLGELWSLIFHFDPNENLRLLVTHKEIGPREMFEPASNGSTRRP